MVKKNTKATTKKTKTKPAKARPRTDIKSVTYEYEDGINCTVTTPAESPNAGSVFSLITVTTPNTNNMKKSNATTSNTNSAATEVTVSNTKPTGAIRSYGDLRIGVKKKEAVEIMEKFSFPDRPFTIKEVLFTTGINHWYVTAYIKANAKVVGDAPKQPGERGKVAKLYQISKA